MVKTGVSGCSEKCLLDWSQSFIRDTKHEKPTPHSRYSFRHTKLCGSWQYTSCLATQLWEGQSNYRYYTSCSYPEIYQINILNENGEMDHSAVGTQGTQYTHFLLRYLWHSLHPPSISKPPHCHTLFRFGSAVYSALWQVLSTDLWRSVRLYEKRLKGILV